VQPAAEQQPERQLLDAESRVPGAVDQAITLLTQQQPSIFDFNNNLCLNCYYVQERGRVRPPGGEEPERGRFLRALRRRRGSRWKNSNSFNEQYDIHLSSGHIRRRQRIVSAHLLAVVVLS